MSNKGKMKIYLSERSAEALTKMQDMETWTVQPTMIRGRKALIDETEPCEPTVADALKRKHHLKQKKTAKPQLKPKPANVSPGAEGELSDGDGVTQYFDRTKKGRAALQKALKKLYLLDLEKFVNHPLFDPDGKCLMQNLNDITWPEIFNNIAGCMESTPLGGLFMVVPFLYTSFFILFHPLSSIFIHFHPFSSTGRFQL